jgi:hypothetical protein
MSVILSDLGGFACDVGRAGKGLLLSEVQNLAIWLVEKNPDHVK